MSTAVLVVAMSLCLSAVAIASSQEAVSCVAIVAPDVEIDEGRGPDAATATRDLLAGRLEGASLRTVSIEARQTTQAIEEARSKQCEHVLFTTLTHKPGGSGNGVGKFLGAVVSNAGQQAVPGGGSVGGAVARAAAVAGTEAIANLAASTKAKDEMRLEYRVESVSGGERIRPATVKVKAKADGEDLMTPVVEKAAAAIAAGLSQK